MQEVICSNAISFLESDYFREKAKCRNVIIVIDPPFNIGYHYKEYDDKMEKKSYFDMLKNICSRFPFVIIHYPEHIYELSVTMGIVPEKVCSWVYNSNTAKQHRDIAYFGVKPIMSQVIQPYKNLTDKRIKERISRGILGGRLYDWWNINQVKNVSKKDINHPCVMPLEVMKNVIGILPKNSIIVDCFCGSGTTGVACKELGYDFIGCDIDEYYCELARRRINGNTD